jgi:WD domain, G-beta repeat
MRSRGNLVMSDCRLTDLLQRDKILPVVRTIDLLAALLHARLHTRKIHGQITPDRVLIKSEYPLKISILAPDAIGIDPEFSAPELINSQASNSSDIYSIGLITIYLLTGVRPFQLFDADNQFNWQDYWHQFSPVSGLNYPKFTALIDRAIAIEPALRFDSAQSMLTALQDCYPALTPPPPNWHCRQLLTGSPGLFTAIKAIAVNDSIVVTGGEDRSIRLWQLDTGKQIATLTGHQKSIHTLAIHPIRTDLLYSSGRDGMIKLWQLDRAIELQSIDTQQSTVNQLAISTDGQLLITAGSDRTIKIWDTDTHTQLNSFRQHRLAVNGVAFNPISAHAVKFASVSSDRQVMLWAFDRAVPLAILTAHTQAVKALAFSPDGKFLATGGDDGSILIWHVDLGQLAYTLSGHHWPITMLLFQPDSNILISSSWDGNLKFWRLDLWHEIDCLTVDRSEVLSLGISPDGRYLITGSRHPTAKIWRSHHLI